MMLLEPEMVTALQDAEVSARVVGLRHVSDQTPGITRERHGKDFRYREPSRKNVRDPVTMRRIKSLVIPPAWTVVLICPNPHGHLVATGRDDLRRKQFRYHPR